MAGSINLLYTACREVVDATKLKTNTIGLFLTINNVCAVQYIVNVASY